MRGGFVRDGKLRTQRFQEIREDSLLTLKGLRPFGCSGNRPTNVVGEILYEGLGVAVRHSSEKILCMSCVLSAESIPRSSLPDAHSSNRWFVLCIFRA